MHQLFIIYKDHKGWRFYRNLRGVIDTQSLSLIRWRLLHRNCLGNNFIQYTGCHTHTVILNYDIDRLKNLIETLS